MNAKNSRLCKSIIVIILFFITIKSTFGQLAISMKQVDTSKVCIIFYNVENLFDTINNPLTADDDFTPNGVRVWNSYKYKNKINSISKVLKAVGGWQIPDIIGLAEIENVQVVNDLVQSEAFKKFNFRYIHQDSKDKRGIEVAFLYRPTRFVPLEYKAISVIHQEDSIKILRDILFIKGIVCNSDTISFFVNHWSSRLGGVLESEKFRKSAAKTLKHFTDSLLEMNTATKIVIMGDFNDYPSNESLKVFLNAAVDSTKKNATLFNLASKYALYENIGSHKNNGKWGCLDQMIVSKELIFGNKNYKVDYNSFQIFNKPFLVEEDVTNLGNKPFRTFNGYIYIGGFSDHFPIYLTLFKNK